MNERGSTDFTVQDVVDRAKMSIRTFYNFFASKDDLEACWDLGATVAATLLT